MTNSQLYDNPVKSVWWREPPGKWPCLLVGTKGPVSLKCYEQVRVDVVSRWERSENEGSSNHRRNSVAFIQGQKRGEGWIGGG